jgi:hypothetical protein
MSSLTEITLQLIYRRWRRAKITEAQMQTESDIRDLKTIVVGLIDKTSNAQNDLIRLDTMIRVRYGLSPDEARIGRLPEPEKRKRK